MSRSLESQQHLSEGNGRNATRRVLEAMGQAYKTEGRAIGYVVQNGPHASIRFIGRMVILDVERFMDSTVSVTRIYPEKDGTLKSKTVLNRRFIRPKALTRLLKRNLPLPKKVS